MFNELGETCTVRRWTLSAIECYERGCVCKGCPINELVKSQKCRMKLSVLELVRVFGAPNKMAQYLSHE